MNIDPGFINTAKWPVFYEDNHLLVVYKPSGLLIQGDCTGDVCLLELARQYIKIRYEKPGNVFLALVHRLDRPVAGVVVFARTSKAASRLGRQFRTGLVEKQYLAVVHGVVPGRGGDLVNNMERKGPTSRIVSATTAKSQEARLSYRVLGTAENKTFLEIDLDTGRHHQIRVQLAHLGFPVMGDLRYGAADPMPQKQLALFAHKLAFDHPTQKQRMTFCAPLPLGWPWLGTPENPDAPVWDWKSLQV
jgi:23S rRNA pseudouridine1911/1915/1917 synthase